jgi:glycosyltransferase involved in cell wall biosynthesis
MGEHRQRVCIIGLKCYDLILGNPNPRYLGGIEAMLVSLGRALRSSTIDVVVITYDFGQPDEEKVGGLTLLKSFCPDQGMRGLRWIRRTISLWRAMRKADADVYVQMGAGLETGLVALGCRALGRISRRRKFVFCLAHDSNYGSDLHAGLLGWEGRAYSYGLHQADAIVSQTERQRQGLFESTGLESAVITIAAAPVPDGSERPQPSLKRILWAGRIVPDKRLELLLEVARRCPEFQFEVAGAPNKESNYAAALLREAKSLQNLTLHGRLGEQDMRKLFQASSILCNTSTKEGFPNTYVEAWSYGMPVVATFDPDGVIARHRLGRGATGVDELVSALRELLQHPDEFQAVSEAARRYYDDNHSPQVVAQRFREILDEQLAV